MQPNLFTMILRHPEADTEVLYEIPAKQIISLCLGASPVQSIVILPANYNDESLTPEQVQERSSECVFCSCHSKGMDVEYLATPGVDCPPWASEIIRGLDYTTMQQRQQAREKREAEVLAMNKARERARPVVLDHKRDKHLFELEQRARLVGA